MKIQPLDVDAWQMVPARSEPGKPVLKSRLKRLFDRPYFRISSVEKPPQTATSTTAAIEVQQLGNKDGGAEFEPISVCLDKMVQNYMEENNDKPFKGGRHRCNCFNANGNDSSDDEFDAFSGGGFGESMINANGSFTDASDILKSLIPCASVAERNLLADTAMIVEKNKNNDKQKDDLRKIMTVALASLGYDASICTSKWDKSPSYPAGEYEFVEVIIEGERLFIDIDFRSEFEIARSTGAYKAILQSLPYIFVGKSDRLGQILSIMSEAAKQSLKKKGMHIPPWRKAEYMRAKWFSPSIRKADAVSKAKSESQGVVEGDECGEFKLIFGEQTTPLDVESEPLSSSSPERTSSEVEEGKVEPMAWQPPVVKPKVVEREARMLTGLASLLKEKP